LGRSKKRLTERIPGESRLAGVTARLNMGGSGIWEDSPDRSGYLARAWDTGVRGELEASKEASRSVSGIKRARSLVETEKE